MALHWAPIGSARSGRRDVFNETRLLSYLRARDARVIDDAQHAFGFLHRLDVPSSGGEGQESGKQKEAGKGRVFRVPL